MAEINTEPKFSAFIQKYEIMLTLAKKSQMTQYILTDIEGTTTSVSFVYEVLFPYFSKNCQDFVTQNMDVAFVQNILADVKKTVLEEENQAISDNQAIEKLLFWTTTDRKHTALKTLQGHVWKLGYEKGDIKGHIYEDVPDVLRAWKEQGMSLGIYSSGSVAAQKLLFGTSIFGDLQPLFSHYFDTQVGAKREANSYQNIQKTLQIPAENILFLSDVEAELDAAQEAGFQTTQLVRGETIASQKHHTASNFTQISLS
jgi:enolase-phosphatase E1